MSNSDDANTSLTGEEPVMSTGPDVGTPSSPAGTVTSAAQEPPGIEHSPTESLSSAALDAPGSGQPTVPGTVPVWCSNCGQPMPTTPRGSCVKCGRMLPGNISRREAPPVDHRRRKHFLARLIVDYAPRTTMETSYCEMLAAILERLDCMKPGGIDHQRLIQEAQTITVSLEESRRNRKEDPHPLAKLTNEEVIAKARAAMQSLQRLIPALEEPTPAPVIEPEDSIGPPESEGTCMCLPIEPDSETLDPINSLPDPSAPCPFCDQSLVQCREIRESDPKWMYEHKSRADVRSLLERQADIRRERGWDERVRKIFND